MDDYPVQEKGGPARLRKPNSSSTTVIGMTQNLFIIGPQYFISRGNIFNLNYH